MGYHLVRYSLLGHVGRFASVDATRYPRQTRVIVRSPRGLEIGEILATPEPEASFIQEAAAEGQILRRVTIEDDLLLARLEKHRHEAFAACSDLLASEAVPAVLVDVEHLFDGQGLFFYFLGEVPSSATGVIERLAATYETKVEFRKFTETLTEGCGPSCGTEEAMGQGGCASCTSCAVAIACGTKH
ncbi:PSP1 C-terminal domain-containing protein [Bythopirellula polymerisocia]|uniref:PSP1 C-terminal domain-containing protein n=1 Tax=Bythopirellula polymerisocia TaxID=2528003 RepID=A0A5C6CMN6_9BACT|nr:PSP1 C-terminal domain-containing protein [Bythopirellula polymerisocia]TWU24591.1 hypothetical protein Pla144_34760 [Bythopirellula polymerisocia]